MTRKRLLLVEDAAIVVRVLTRALAGLEGLELCGHTGRVGDALAKIAELTPEFVILDVHLEDGEGLRVLEYLRGRPAPPCCLVFSNDHQQRAPYLAAGADYFFDKSTEFLALVATLKRRCREQPPS